MGEHSKTDPLPPLTYVKLLIGLDTESQLNARFEYTPESCCPRFYLAPVSCRNAELSEYVSHCITHHPTFSADTDTESLKPISLPS